MSRLGINWYLLINVNLERKNNGPTAFKFIAFPYHADFFFFFFAKAEEEPWLSYLQAPPKMTSEVILIQ